MSGRIQRLDPLVAERIAAGEVIDRPASVVRELVDNAIDAQARSIEVECSMDPCACLRVSDDGIGMDAADLALSIERHATSKLTRVEDLDALHSLGFRGEALPSIAAVAQVRLTSCVRGGQEAHSICVRGLQHGPVQATVAARASGTTVEVRDLFAAVPARRKFLRADAYEQAQITEVLTRLALARPTLRFDLKREGRRVRVWPAAASLAARAAQVFAPGRLIEVTGQRDGVRVEAALAAPEAARAQRSGLHLLVNGRAVRDKTLAGALAFAYGELLPPGRFPVGVVAIAVDPASIDVNVHPQKAELRFAQPRRIIEALTRVVAPAVHGGRVHAFGARPQAQRPPMWPRDAPATPAKRPAATQPSPVQPDAACGDVGAMLRDAGGRQPEGVMLRDAGGRQPEGATAASAPPTATAWQAATGGRDPAGTRGQMHAFPWQWVHTGAEGLLLCADAEALWVLDVHALDERARLATLEAALAQGPLEPAPLTFPERIAVAPAVLQWCRQSAALLEAVGLGLEVDAAQVTVHQVPLLCRGRPVTTLLQPLWQAVLNRPPTSAAALLPWLACGAALAAGSALGEVQARALLQAHGPDLHAPSRAVHSQCVVQHSSFAALTLRRARLQQAPRP